MGHQTARLRIAMRHIGEALFSLVDLPVELDQELETFVATPRRMRVTVMPAVEPIRGV
jgi:hypothetical protein